jgi:hypothetical protein
MYVSAQSLDFLDLAEKCLISDLEIASAHLFISGWALAGQFSEAGNQSDLRAFLYSLSRQLRRFNIVLVFPEGHQPDGLHDSGQINTSRASHIATVASGTHPACIELFYLLCHAQLRHVNDLAWEGLHMIPHGARSPAGSALKALMYLLATQLFYLLKEAFINRLW